MKIRLKLLGMLMCISAFKDEKEIKVDFMGNTIGDLVNHLLSMIELEEERQLLNEQGEISPELLIFINGTFIPGRDRFSRPLGEGDLVELALACG